MKGRLPVTMVTAMAANLPGAAEPFRRRFIFPGGGQHLAPPETHSARA